MRYLVVSWKYIKCVPIERKLNLANVLANRIEQSQMFKDIKDI